MVVEIHKELECRTCIQRYCNWYVPVYYSKACTVQSNWVSIHILQRQLDLMGLHGLFSNRYLGSKQCKMEMK